MQKLVFSVLVLTLFSCRKTDDFTHIGTTTTNTAIVATAVDTVFYGYKVAPNARQLGSSYWQNTQVLPDIMVDIFQKGITQGNNGLSCLSAFTTQLALGDFNNDGYIDVFNAGSAYNGIQSNLSFLIWDTASKTFKEQNLINDKTNFIGGPIKVVPVYLNGDNYVDLVIFGHHDEGDSNSPLEPITLVISDGKGGYDLTKLDGLIQPDLLHFTIEGGDVGDLNEDGIPDLLVTCNSHTYIFWGIPSYPYFTNNGFADFASDTKNFHPDNGFGEVVTAAAGAAYGGRIMDVNNDGKNDLVICFGEDKTNNVQQKILLNQGKGRFNDQNVDTLPYYSATNVVQIDYIVDDLNGDGLKDLIALNTVNYSTWNIVVYIQQSNGSFNIDNSWIINDPNLTKTSWRGKLVYYDFNNDGKKDIGYIDAGVTQYNTPNNLLYNKTIFLRTGNSFVEKNYYQYDNYTNKLRTTYFKGN